MGNLVGKGSTDPEDSTESNKETTAADVGIVSYEPHLDIYQDKAKSTPHSPATKSGAETSENGENVTVDLKGKGWRKNSSATAHTGKPERQRLEIQNRGSINDVSEIGRLQGGPSTGPASNPVGLNQNAASHKSDAKRDGEVASHSHKKKVLKPWITVESDNTKGLKGPFGKLANQSRKYSDPNLEDTSNGSGVQFDNSNAYPVYKRCKMLSPTDNNGDDSVFPGPRKNSLGGQSLSSEYGPPADDVSEDTSSTPWDGSPNQDYMKLYWSSRGSKDSNSSQRRASDNLVKVVGEISILQQELQELLSEKERTRTAGMEEPHLLGSPSGSLRSRLKGYSIHNSSEALHSSDTEMRLIELAKSWQSRLLNIQKMTDSSLKDLESPTATQDKQQKTPFSGDPEVRTILTEDGKQDVKQLEVEVKRLQSLLAQQENENKNLTMVKNKEIRDLSQEESQLKMELLAKESELKVLREKALSLEKALEQAHRECKAQLDKTLSLAKALERGHREHRADIEKVASLEKTLQQELREHRAETERVVTLEKVLEQERREHRAETERAMSLEKTLEQARSEHRVQIERASSLKKTLEQADSMQRVRTDRALSLEKELERTQDDLRAQTERASSLENSLNQLSSELKAQTERALSLEKEQSLRLDMETTLIRMRDLARQLEGEKTELQKKLQDLQEKMQADAEEWRQFQADLQTAVAVADDFKMEAEEELLATREKLWDVEKENERLKMELGRRKGTDTVDHGSYLEKRKEEAPNSLIGLPAVNGISRVRKTLHAESTAPSIQTDTEIPGSLRTTSLVKKAPRITFQTTGNESSLAKNEERRAQQRNPVALEASLSELNKTREKSPDKPGSQVRRYGGSRRNTLLQWCQSRTLGYKNIEITNFSVCWSDGMSLCALFHSYLPDRIPYGELNPAHKKQNLTLAFETGKSIGIPQTLSVEEMLDRDGPDWQSVLGYVESIYQHFEQ